MQKLSVSAEVGLTSNGDGTYEITVANSKPTVEATPGTGNNDGDFCPVVSISPAGGIELISNKYNGTAAQPKSNSSATIKLKVIDGAADETYTITISNSEYNRFAVVDGPLTYTIIVNHSIPSTSSDPSTGGTTVQTAVTSLSEDKVEVVPVYIPLTPEEIYQNTLKAAYPHGYAFVKMNEETIFQDTSIDGKTSTFWKEGVKLGSISLTGADGTALKLQVHAPDKKDDTNATPWIWANVKAGETPTLVTTGDLAEAGITEIQINKTVVPVN